MTCVHLKKLIEFGSENHTNKTQAISVVRQILSNPIYNPNPLGDINWELVGIDSKKAVFSEFQIKFSLLQNLDKVPFFKAIWNAENIDRKAKLEFFL